MIARIPTAAPSPGAAVDASAPPAGASNPPPWRRRLAEAVRSVGELLELVRVEPRQLDAALRAQRDFPLRVPRGFVARMRPGDPRDPLLLQVLPAADELDEVPGFSRDPLDEAGTSPVPGLLHKFHGRVLFITSAACGIHCRYCFRRHFPYAEHRPRGDGFRRAIDYVAANPSIEEVILSGGDPLAMTDDKLAGLAAELAAVPHLRRLRVHSRMPIVLPERVDAALVAWLTGTRLTPILVVHANHPREIDPEVTAALGRLRTAGVTLLNQTVLLRGVNDDPEALAALSRALFSAGALPYYLNLLDRVAGAAHFAIDDQRARQIGRRLMAELPGYLVPRLVREVPGAPAKMPLALDDPELS